MKISPLLPAALAPALLLLAACSHLPHSSKHQPPTITTGTINIGQASLYPAGAANARFAPTHGFVVTNESGTVLVIRTTCTHDGHPVEWCPSQQRFTCSLDRCEYDLLGQPSRAPAQSPLNSVLAVPQTDGSLTVDLDKLYAKPVPRTGKK